MTIHIQQDRGHDLGSGGGKGKPEDDREHSKNGYEVEEEERAGDGTHSKLHAARQQQWRMKKGRATAQWWLQRRLRRKETARWWP